MLIDSFLFFNETELVELRIKYLNNIVDCFVIVEADITHQGKKKDWNFPKILENNLKEFSGKIQYHQLNIDPEKIKFDNLDDITLIVYKRNIISFASILNKPIWPKNISRIFNRILRNKEFDWVNPTFGIISKLTHDHQIKYCKNIGKDYVFLSIEGQKRKYLQRWTEQANEYSPGWSLCNDKKLVETGPPKNCLQHIIYKKISDTNEPFSL